MENITEKAESIGSIIILSILYLLGGFTEWLKIFLIVILIDYFTGVLKALYTGKIVSSRIGIKGIVKKLFYLILVATMVAFDDMINTIYPNFPIQIIVKGKVDTFGARDAAIFLITINEIVSILENLKEMGLPVEHFIVFFKRIFGWVKIILDKLTSKIDKTVNKFLDN